MKNFLKNWLTAIIVIQIIILEVLSVNASAEEVNLPLSTPSAVKTAIADGEICLTDELLRKLQICDALYEGFYSLESSINLINLRINYKTESDLFSECINYVLIRPDMFQAKRLLTNRNIKLYDSENYLVRIEPDYAANITDACGNAVFDKELALAEIAEYEELSKALAEKIPEDISDMEKMLFLYDYIALNFEYDEDYIDESYDAYHFLKNKKGVCEAYAKTYNKVFEMLGVPVLTAFSDVDNHAWNIVKIDGNYYHIDTTWADPTPDRSGNVDHSYFLKSSAALPLNQEGKGHRKWYIKESCFGLDISCNSTVFDCGYLWNEADTAFSSYNGEYYYIDDITYENQAATTGTVSAVIRKTTDFKTAQDVLKIDTSAWCDTSCQYILLDYNSGLYMVGSQIYYNNHNTLMYYDVNNGTSKEVFKLEDSNITNFNYCGNGKFQYNEFSVVNSRAVFTKKEYSILDMGSISNNETATWADDLISMRKYISNENSIDLCLLKGDLSLGDGKIDVRDLVALKKLAIE